MELIPQIDQTHLEKITRAFDVVCQPKSNFQIEKFVVGQHDTPERQYVQCVIQLHALVCNIKRGEINRRRKLIEIKSLEKETGELAELDLAEKQVDLEQIEFSLKGALREFSCYFAILENFKEGFTYEEIQNGEANYWMMRLSRQSQCDRESTGRIGIGNREALWQAGFIPNPALKFMEENKHAKINA